MDFGLYGFGCGDVGYEVGLYFVELCVDGIEFVLGCCIEYGYE